MNKPTKIQKIESLLKWFVVYVPLGLFALVTAPIIAVICFPFSTLKKWNPFYWVFWLWMDSEIYNTKTNADWKVYKKGNFFRWYLWHAFRNTMWNLKVLIKPKSARVSCKSNDEVIIEVIQDDLINNGKPISTKGTCLVMAGLKWITKEGDKGWHVFNGEKISKEYSIIGTSELWYKAKRSLYYRYSTVRVVKLFSKRYWLYFAMGTTEKRYLLNFKIYNYQKLH
jgi:hypothetical protein